MKILILFLNGAAVLFLLLACAPTSSSPAAREAAAGTAGVASAPVVSAQAAWEKQWQQVLVAAKKEGKVSLYTSLGGEGLQMVRQGFTRQFGIEVETTVASRGSEVAEKLTRERRAGIFFADVSTTGSTTSILLMKPRGILAPMPPALILPEVIDPKAWWKGELDWADQDKTVINFSAYPSSPLAINTDLVRNDEIKSYRDLLNPKWKGKITLNDPTVTGVGPKLIGAIGQKIMGLDFLRDLAKMEPLITRDQRLQVDWLAHGKYPIAIMPDSPTMIEFRRLGAPIIDFSPAEGSFLSSGYGVVVLIDQPPHPNAAKVFLNWLLGRDGGLVFSKATNAQSGRVDVATDHLPQSRVRQPGIKYVDAYSEQFVLSEAEQMGIAKEIFGHLIK